ncbi:MAG: sigma-70 family RNA polymerase sigma factor [bacterium]
MPEVEDRHILDLIGQPESRNYGFDLLVRKYQERVYWLVRRIVISHEDADDVVQNIFIQVWEHIDSFRGDSQVYTWIYRIAVNEALRWLNKNRLKQLVSFSTVGRKLEETLTADPFFLGTELELKLQKAMLRLPFKQRLVFQMKYYDAMKYKEISEILGTTVGALKASYHHAVKKIEQTLLNY